MKKTRWIEFFKNIRDTKVAFASILLFVALAAAVYTGLSWSGEAFVRSVEEDYGRFCLYDAEIVFPGGLSEEQIRSLAEAEPASRAEGIYSCYSYFERDGKKLQAKIMSVPKTINAFSVTEGTLPTQADELAAEKFWATENGVQIGDTITFLHDEDEQTYFLAALTEKDTQALCDGQSSGDGMRWLCGDTFTVTALVESPVYISRYPLTYGLCAETNTPIDCLLYGGEAVFDERAFCGYPGAVLVCDGLRGMDTLSEEYKTEARAMKSRLEQRADELADERTRQLRQNADALLNDARQASKLAQSACSQAERSLDAMGVRGAMKNARLKELRSAVRESAQAYDELSGQLSELDELEAGVLLREDNACVGVIEVMRDMTGSLSGSMALLFVIVGLLVCYSAVSRIVYEHSLLIGTKKAMGFTEAEITRHYLAYAALAAVLGSALGMAAGVFGIEWIFQTVTKKDYAVLSDCRVYSWEKILIFSGAEVAVQMLTAFFACRSVLRKKAVTLLAGPEPPVIRTHFFEKSRLWRRLPVFSKAVIVNFLTEKRRVISTLIGIAGSMSLLVCALSLQNSVDASIRVQYERLQTMRTIVYFDAQKDSAQKAVRQVLEEYGPGEAAITGGLILMPDEKQLPVEILVIDEPVSERMFRLYGPDGRRGTLRQAGVWASCAFPEEYGLREGDTILLNDAGGNSREAVIGGIYEYYLTRNQLIMTEQAYEEIFGEPAQINAFLLEQDAQSIRSLQPRLMQTDGFLSVRDYYESSYKAFLSIGSTVSLVVTIYAVLSVLMAFLVTLNLLTMFVEEKRREIITLRINGFSERRTMRYIRGDTALLTVLGILAGAAVGLYSGRKAIVSICTASSYFYRALSPDACLRSAVFCAVLTAVITQLALRRARRFSLSDLNR